MPIAVVEKTFQVLEALARIGEAAPLIRISAEAGLPKPTAYRILQSLAGLGYVGQEEATAHYFATDRLAALAGRDPYLAAKQAALPIMERVHAKFDETVNLGVLEGNRVVYAHVLETSQDLRWVVRPGRSDFFYCTALGRAIAAFLPEDRLERLLKKTTFEKVGAKTITDRKKLLGILKETRRRGWAIEEEEASSGVACLAVPLKNRGVPGAALSVSVPVSRFTPALKRAVIEQFALLTEAPKLTGRAE